MQILFLWLHTQESLYKTRALVCPHTSLKRSFYPFFSFHSHISLHVLHRLKGTLSGNMRSSKSKLTCPMLFLFLFLFDVFCCPQSFECFRVSLARVQQALIYMFSQQERTKSSTPILKIDRHWIWNLLIWSKPWRQSRFSKGLLHWWRDPEALFVSPQSWQKISDSCIWHNESMLTAFSVL